MRYQNTYTTPRVTYLPYSPLSCLPTLAQICVVDLQVPTAVDVSLKRAKYPGYNTRVDTGTECCKGPVAPDIEITGDSKMCDELWRIHGINMIRAYKC